MQHLLSAEAERLLHRLDAAAERINPFLILAAMILGIVLFSVVVATALSHLPHGQTGGPPPSMDPLPLTATMPMPPS